MAYYSQDGKQIIFDGSPKSLFKSGFHSEGEKVTGLFNEPWGYQHFRDFRWRPYIVQDTELSVDASSRRNYLSLSRQMFAQMGILDFALEMICDWAIGDHYDLIYTGPDNTFRDNFEEYANNTWAKNCSVKGSTYNLKNILKLIVREVIRDGDLLQLYTFNRAGLPQLQYVRSHRIFQRNNTKKIEDGRYAGFVVEDGVIKNSYGSPIAYYIQDPVTEEDDYIVNVNNCVLIMNPRYFDKDRGIPAIAPSILDACSSQELNDAIQRRLKLEALVALKYHNATGEAPSHNTGVWPQIEDTTSTALAPPIQMGVQVMKGGIKYIEAGNGSDITTLSSTTPNVQATEYMADLETKLLSTIGVPHQLLFSPTDISRSPARGISEIFKKTISKTQSLVEQFIYPAVVWAIGNAISQGLLAGPASSKEKWWNNIDFTRPAQFTLDAFNEAKQQMDFFKLGLITRDEITTSRQGKRGSNIIDSRQQEIVSTWSAAIEAKRALDDKYSNDISPVIQSEVKSITANMLHNGLELFTSNPLPEPSSNTNNQTDNNPT